MSQELTPVLTQEAQPIQTSAMALAPMALAEQYLTELNLPIEQAAQAIELANQISLIPNDKSAASSLGKDCSSRMTAYADTILSQIKTIDEHGVQDRLSELVLNAKSLNLKGIGRKSSVPVIGGLIDKFIYKTDEWKLEFQSVASKINTLLEELKNGERNIITRQKELDGLFDATQHEYKQLGLTIVAGKVKQVELAQLIEHEIPQVEGDQLKAQHVSDLRSLGVVLDKRVSDLLALQTSAMQTLPSIRL
ncbi:MAG: toxic anion resistance protein, partial [Formosimonas sp.]